MSVSQGPLSSSTNDKSYIDGTSIAVSIIVTFVVTAAAVGFLSVVVGLVLHTHSKKKKKKKQKEKEPSYWSSK